MQLILTVTAEDMQWARNAAAWAKEEFPRLDPNGVQPFDKEAPREIDDHTLRLVPLARMWLENFDRTLRPNTSRSSYGLKHCAEIWANHYISNTALIIAAVGLEIPQRPCERRSPNTYLALSYRSWPQGLRSFSDGHFISKVVFETEQPEGDA